MVVLVFMSQQIQSGGAFISFIVRFGFVYMLLDHLSPCMHACMGLSRVPDMHAGEQRCSGAGDYLREAPQGHVRRSNTDAGKYTASVLTGKKPPVSLLVCVLLLNDATLKGRRSCSMYTAID